MKKKREKSDKQAKEFLRNLKVPKKTLKKPFSFAMTTCEILLNFVVSCYNFFRTPKYDVL